MKTIQDAIIRSLEYAENSEGRLLRMLRFEDHLLSRFGAADFLRASSGMHVRIEAEEKSDQIWILVDGVAEVTLTDRRSDSPSEDQQEIYVLESPSLFLVPFGVEATILSLDSDVSCVRISTEEDGSIPEWSL